MFSRCSSQRLMDKMGFLRLLREAGVWCASKDCTRTSAIPSLLTSVCQCKDRLVVISRVVVQWVDDGNTQNGRIVQIQTAKISILCRGENVWQTQKLSREISVSFFFVPNKETLRIRLEPPLCENGISASVSRNHLPKMFELLGIVLLDNPMIPGNPWSHP